MGIAVVPKWLALAVAPPGLVPVPVELGIMHGFVVVFPTGSRRRVLAEDFARACREAMPL